MELSLDYNYSTKYIPEVYTLIALLIIIVVFIIASFIYYYARYMNKVKIETSKVEILINILLSAAFMSGFLCVFYFTYITGIEEKVVVNNIVDVLDKNISKVPPGFITTLQADNIIPATTGIIPEINAIADAGADGGADVALSDSDLVTIQKNKNIEIKAILIFGIFTVVIIIFSFLILRYFRLNYKKIFILNGILLASIALIEFIFATYFVANFINIDLNNLIYITLSVFYTIE
jgi:hypothetical protein